MSEILFYHLQGQPLRSVLPNLLERSLARGWKALVKAATAERLAALDDDLWTYQDESFLPHASDREAEPETQPILLTLGESNPNRAEVLFLVEGAAIPADAGTYQRLVILFDGTDPDALAAARRQWSEAKTGGHAITYWQQDEDGRWQRKA